MAKLKQVKREEAEDRRAIYNGMSPKQKLDSLDRKLGKGVGAIKERTRLQALLTK